MLDDDALIDGQLVLDKCRDLPLNLGYMIRYMYS